jgi:transposase
MPGKRLASITPGRRRVYEALKRQGMSKERAAKIANAGKTASGRRALSRNAARRREEQG